MKQICKIKFNNTLKTIKSVTKILFLWSFIINFLNFRWIKLKFKNIYVFFFHGTEMKITLFSLSIHNFPIKFSIIEFVICSFNKTKIVLRISIIISMRYNFWKLRPWITKICKLIAWGIFLHIYLDNYFLMNKFILNLNDETFDCSQSFFTPI